MWRSKEGNEILNRGYGRTQTLSGLIMMYPKYRSLASVGQDVYKTACPVLSLRIGGSLLGSTTRVL